MIIVIDSICGSGKTQYAIQMINESDKDTKFIYITPFLDEVARIKKYSNKKFVEPHVGLGKGRKINHFKDLVIDGKNIVSTHALFTNIDDSVLNSIKYHGYTLILDEVIDVLDNRIISNKDWLMLTNEKYLEVEETTNKIVWLDQEYEGKFDEIKQLANSNNLYLHSRSQQNKNKILLIWTFPIEVFKSFREVFNLTYMFDGQLQKYYFDMYNQTYVYKSVIKNNGVYELVDYDKKLDNREVYKSLINIYNGNLNMIGDDINSLSKSWFDRNIKDGNIKILKNCIYNYFNNVINGNSKYNLWTTFRGYDNNKDKIRLMLTGNRYNRSFLSCNARATNNYIDRYNCVYALNRFINPVDKGFFEDKNITINSDLWSVSELIQWLFRSRLRNKESINLFIPSKRMRELLIDWLEYKI